LSTEVHLPIQLSDVEFLDAVEMSTILYRIMRDYCMLEKWDGLLS
jgi:hypothetical protein